jgi:hypothetical protein
MNTLDIIGKKYGTDKTSECHNYCVKYEKYLPMNRYDKLNILEIGVLKGESLRMWKDYFYNSNIIGIDINPDFAIKSEDRITTEIGSQTDINFLSTVSDKHGPFDLIIDDGSHMNSDVITSFEFLFHKLKPQGVYIVEDCCTSYWNDYGGGNHPNTMINYFKNLIDNVNFFGVTNNITGFYHARNENLLTESIQKNNIICRTDIESICFLNGIILITKR